MENTVGSPSNWGQEHIEHLALRAAELGDTLTEQLCDEVVAGETDVDVLVSIVDGDWRYGDWMARGVELGWRARWPSNSGTDEGADQ